MSNRTHLMPADEFLASPDDGMWHELVRGEVTTTPLPGGRHGKIAARLLRRIGNHVEEHSLGDTFAAETATSSSAAPTRSAVVMWASSAANGSRRSSFQLH